MPRGLSSFSSSLYLSLRKYSVRGVILLKHYVGGAGNEKLRTKTWLREATDGRYLHCRVHEAGVSQVGEPTEARALTLPALFRVIIAVAVGWVRGGQTVAGVLNTEV